MLAQPASRRQTAPECADLQSTAAALEVMRTLGRMDHLVSDIQAIDQAPVAHGPIVAFAVWRDEARSLRNISRETPSLETVASQELYLLNERLEVGDYDGYRDEVHRFQDRLQAEVTSSIAECLTRAGYSPRRK